MTVRVRIAPSPTGPLHIGTARTALFNFLFARKNSGIFILRIEDTDKERSDPLFEKEIKEALEWLGLFADEFYRQSERLDLYEEYLGKLLSEKKIFWCPHSRDDLAEEKRLQIARKEPPRHICEFRDKSLKNDEDKSILRFRNDASEEIVFEDLVRDKIAFSPKMLGDFSVAKDLKNPLYNFAVVIDDSDMKISHVIRGEDHISNTPKQILLARALGFEAPKYAHIPLILGQDRSKLSKRHGAVSVLEYKKSGYLPEAVLNFMALLGWHPAPEQARYGASSESEKEIFTMDELVKEFSLERVQKGGAVFDLNKLRWLNKEHIKKMKKEDLARRLEEFLPPDLKDEVKSNSEKWLKIADVVRDRLTTLDEAGEMVSYFYKEPYYSKELLSWKENQTVENIFRHLEKVKGELLKLDKIKWNEKGIERVLIPYAEREGKGEVLWPLRVALSGKRASAGPFEIAEILGKEETLKRVEKAAISLS